MAQALEGAAEDFDASARSMPAGVDAGPFGPPAAKLMEAVGANCAALVVRMTKAADDVRIAADRYEHTEHVSQGGLEELLTDGLDDAGR